MIPYKDVDRVEIIDQTGRTFTRYGVSGGVEVVLQDGGRTLKIFLEHSNWKMQRNGGGVSSEPEE